MKEKIKTTSFWIGLCGAIMVIFDSISGLIGIAEYSDEIKNILFSICTILVLCGVIDKKDESEEKTSSSQELIDEIENNIQDRDN